MNKQNVKFDKEPVAEKVKEAPVAIEPHKFRYVCDGCTKDVLTATNNMVGVEVVCPHCGKHQITVPENWVVL